MTEIATELRHALQDMSSVVLDGTAAPANAVQSTAQLYPAPYLASRTGIG